MPYTAEQFAELVEAVRQKVLSLVNFVVKPAGGTHNAKTLDRSILGREQEEWAGTATTETDLDAQGKPRVHLWQVSFAGLGGPPSAAVGSYEPQLTFNIDGFYKHEFGTDADNSEKRFTAEVARLAFTLAASPGLNVNGTTLRHSQLQARVSLGPLGAVRTHRCFATLTVDVQPLRYR
jgi:hypothetical protein